MATMSNIVWEKRQEGKGEFMENKLKFNFCTGFKRRCGLTDDDKRKRRWMWVCMSKLPKLFGHADAVGLHVQTSKALWTCRRSKMF